ncbi:bifunctional transcriptional activator/DNA repair enzyme AdaA [Shewanella marina]|uniref:bifunctional transcriptional activator/DNA repair enzyme AdaA n=1 Tax=Shewanella marina TaxID=487319 RepID=UPI00046F9956|nr:bifunctional transcriptional activator/DNA repair protein Ada [Shewanella marina]
MQILDAQLIDSYYQALLQRDPQYVGSFFVGVKTTGIFCIATCRARKPMPQNVVFYSQFKDALDAGFRPCKVCRPTENAASAPHYIEQAIALVRASPKQKVTDAQLRQQGLQPEQIRRWFKHHYQMTFQTFARMYRINIAYQELQQHQTATNAAFDAGYDSLSGFNYTFKKLIGQSPSMSKQQDIIYMSRLTTPIGPMYICATEQGVCLLEFVDRRMLETEFSDLQKRLKARIITGENAHIIQAKQQLAQYFAGDRIAFDVPLHTPGTEFQNKVWQILQTIGYGDTRSYLQQAEAIGNPKAVRAVASANGHNRIAIIIPCHRVIGKDGKLVGYAGGLARKKWLLEHELNNATA